MRNEYLGAENRILRAQIKGRLLLSEGEKATLAEIAQRLGRKGLEELAAVAKPDTLLAWYRKLIANKFDGSRFRQRVGRPRMDEEAELSLANCYFAHDSPEFQRNVTNVTLCRKPLNRICADLKSGACTEFSQQGTQEHTESSNHQQGQAAWLGNPYGQETRTA